MGALAVAVVALLLFAPALANGFAYDDVPIVLGDARVQSFQHLGAIFTRGWWADADLALYRPLTTLSFALDWQLAPASGAWFHFVNVLLHAAASVLAFLLLARLWSPGPALVAGLVFATHPVHVEAVANVVGRAELLSAVFLFACCLLWLRWQPAVRQEKAVARPRGHPARAVGADAGAMPDASAAASDGPGEAGFDEAGSRPVRGVLLPALLFALALLSKESAIMLPAVLILMDGATGALRIRELASYLKRNGPALAAMVVVAIAYMALRAAVLGAVTPGRLDPLLEATTSPASRLFTALQAWPVWARLLFFPDELLADWGPRTLMPATGLTPAATVGLILIAATVIGGGIAMLTGRGRGALALFWFPVTMLPVSNLIVPIGVLVAERTLYAPSFVVALAVAALAAQSVFATHGAATAVPDRHSADPATMPEPAARVPAAMTASARRAGLALLILVLALFGLRVTTRIPDWRSTDTVMMALVRDRPESFRGHWHLARMARSQSNVDAAVAQYDTAVALWPHRQRLVLEAAGYAIEQKRHGHTLALATLAAKRWPHDIASQRLLAAAAMDAGDVVTAERAIVDGLRLAPGDSVLQRMSAGIAAWRRSAGH